MGTDTAREGDVDGVWVGLLVQWFVQWSDRWESIRWAGKGLCNSWTRNDHENIRRLLDAMRPELKRAEVEVESSLAANRVNSGARCRLHVWESAVRLGTILLDHITVGNDEAQAVRMLFAAAASWITIASSVDGGPHTQALVDQVSANQRDIEVLTEAAWQRVVSVRPVAGGGGAL